MHTTVKGCSMLLLLATTAALAQDAAVPDQEADRAAEIDALQPGVDTREPVGEIAAAENADTPEPVAQLAEDIRRRSAGNGVMDELDLGRTEITGNQELPKVLYIVPWQKSDPGELTGKPINTLLDEVLAPIDRSEFIRQVEYYDDLYRDDRQ